jgi:phosphoserine phosphatase RsbU/P
LGLFEDEIYGAECIFMQPGDTLFVFSDGVTEAMDADCRLFSKDRLIKEISSRANKSPKELVEELLTEVLQFEAGVPQADDITMLAVRYNGPGARPALEFTMEIRE